jgi:regulator of RNase E activity RraA
MGELSAETLQFRGIQGYIVDGGCRDTDFILKIGFPVFCRYFTPMDVVGRWKADAFGEPVVIGQVTLRTGDYVLADRDGIVLIPADLAEVVISRTEVVMRTENLVRKAILQGMDPQEAYLKYGKF